MYILQIEHRVPDYEDWKSGFDADPTNRANMGIKKYQILRLLGDPNLVIVELQFESPEIVEKALHTLQELWSTREGSKMAVPKARVLEIVETKSE